MEDQLRVMVGLKASVSLFLTSTYQITQLRIEEEMNENFGSGLPSRVTYEGRGGCF